jgi:hypothetical protein
MTGRSVNAGNGASTYNGPGNPTRDFEQEMLRQAQPHWWRLV